jgi:nucleotide-binding universal stress UspA family protein
MATLEPVTRISFKNIFLATDFSETSCSAVPFALAFARLYGARLVAAHFLEPKPRLQVVFDRLPEQDDQDWIDAKQKLLAFAQTASADDVPCRTVLERGEIDTLVPSLIEENSIDLVVLGTHGRRGVSKLVRGSVAEKIYRSATCPVLTVGPKAHCDAAKPWRIARMLFSVDLAERPEPALHYALSLAEEQQASLLLLHANPLVPWQYQAHSAERAVHSLSDLLPEDAKLWCQPECMVRWELPAEAILNVAQEREIDLIVMGVHKARAASLSSHLPWPIASEVVSRASCPVLTVRI